MKSHASDYVSFCRCVLIDAFAKCSTGKDGFQRDLDTIQARLKHEGLSFLTITLPGFGQEFERSLTIGRVASTNFAGWRRWRSLPAFLRGLTKLVFDAATGVLYDNPDLAAIEGIRQIAYTFKKLSIPCTPERECMALQGYQEVEQFLSESSVHPRDIDLFDQVSSLLWGNVLNEEFDTQRYIPRHGPGQTAERISGNRKYAHRSWYERLEPFFPSDSYLMSCVSQLFDKTEGIESVQFVSSEQELPVRVTTVPKTLKGPRIIAMEPVCMQYAQQALAAYLIRKLESSWLTKGHINFSDQSINRDLAMRASRDGSLATLDLSSASDRVPAELVSRMLDGAPDFRDASFACRSETAQLPSGEVIRLKKFASMGSALCFPIESMYFLTVILVALFEKQKAPVTLGGIKRLISQVFVYGDDIIVPVNAVDAVMDTLTRFLCKVNTHKSFWTGKFRESCGMDAFAGECVTPTYLRQVQPRDRDSVHEIISWVETRNLFYKRGYWVTSAYMKMIVEGILGELPTILETSPGLGWVSFLKGLSWHRWNKRLHRPEILTYVVTPVYKVDKLGGWSALLKCLLQMEQRAQGVQAGPVDDKHLQRSPRSGTSSIKRRWTTPY